MSVSSLLTWYLRNPEGEFHYIWHKHPRGLNDEVTGFSWSKVKGYCDLTEHVFGLKHKNSFANYRPNSTLTSNRIKSWGNDVLYPKLNSTVTSYCSANSHLCILVSAVTQRLNNLWHIRQPNPDDWSDLLCCVGICKSFFAITSIFEKVMIHKPWFTTTNFIYHMYTCVTGDETTAETKQTNHEKERHKRVSTKIPNCKCSYV